MTKSKWKALPLIALIITIAIQAGLPVSVFAEARKSSKIDLATIDMQQKMDMVFTESQRYYIVTEDEMTALTAVHYNKQADFSSDFSGDVRFEKFTGDEAQKWIIYPSANWEGQFRINNYINGGAIDVVDRRTAAGTDLRLYMPLDFESQVYTLTMVEPGIFTMQAYTNVTAENPEHRNLYVGGKGGKSTEGTLAEIAEKAVRFKLLEVDIELRDRITVPQTGWAPGAQKKAIISMIEKLGDIAYTVTNSRSGAVVMEGTVGIDEYKTFQMYTAIIDLTSLTEPGKYTISVDAENIRPQDFYISSTAFTALRGTDYYDRTVETTITIKDMIEKFYAHQRCNEKCVLPIEDFKYNFDPGEGMHFGNDTNLPIYKMQNIVNGNGKNNAGEPTGEFWADAFGGYHDATSTDKETGNIAKGMESLQIAYLYTTDEENKKLLLDEIIWGCDYLLKIQKDNGAFYLAVKPHDWYNKDNPPRNIVDLDGADLTARVASVLARASYLMKDSENPKADLYLKAAENAWEYCQKNPDNFINRDVYPIYWIGNQGSIFSMAVSLFQATGSDVYKQTAEMYVTEGYFRSGVFSRMDEPWPGQMGSYQEELDQGNAIVAYCMYYPYAEGDTKANMMTQMDNFVMEWLYRCFSPYGIDTGIPTTFFGCCGWMMQEAEKIGLIANVFDNKNALMYANNLYDFVVGKNPLGSCFIVGAGDVLSCLPYVRSIENTIGAVLPGLCINQGDRRLTSRTEDLSIHWKFGETGIDVGSAVPSTLALLDYAYNVKQMSFVETAGQAEDNSVGTAEPTDSGESNDVQEQGNNVRIIIIVIVVVAASVGAISIILYKRKNR